MQQGYVKTQTVGSVFFFSVCVLSLVSGLCSFSTSRTLIYLLSGDKHEEVCVRKPYSVGSVAALSIYPCPLLNWWIHISFLCKFTFLSGTSHGHQGCTKFHNYLLKYSILYFPSYLPSYLGAILKLRKDDFSNF